MSQFRTALLAASISTLSFGALATTADATPSSTSTPATASTPSSTAALATYEVQSGDYLAGIATKLKVKLTELLSVNKMSTASVIHPGDKLSVPKGGIVPLTKVNAGATLGPSTGVTRSAASAAAPVVTTPAKSNGKNTSAPTTTTPSSTAPTTPAAATTSSYVIKANDYLAGIATQHGVTLTALLKANKLIATSSIQPGDKLTIPPATLPLPPTSAATDTSTTTTLPAGDPTTSAGKIAIVLTYLKAQIGKPYFFNTAGPDSFDCSGLVTAAYLQIGINLPHQSLLQSKKGTAVDWHTEAILPGDLVFEFSHNNPTVISHVGVAIDATHWIQAAGTNIPVAIGPIPATDKIQAVRRIVQP